MVSNYDFHTTLLNYLGLADQAHTLPESPGRDYSSVLRGGEPAWENVIYYEFENSRMIRTDQWKYTRRFPSGPNELYDLECDPGEKENLAGRPEFADHEKSLDKRLTDFFARYADPQYDLWRGGRSKATRME
jgi:arylsulfatase A-like enzyme